MKVTAPVPAAPVPAAPVPPAPAAADAALKAAEKAKADEAKAAAKAAKDAEKAKAAEAKAAAKAEKDAAKASAKAEKEAAKAAKQAERDAKAAEKAAKAVKMPEQNGIRQPRAGGLCAKVWDIASDLRAKGGDVTPTMSAVLDVVKAQGMSEGNARTEYARWRTFHGYPSVGRAKTEKAPPVPAAPAA